MSPSKLSAICDGLIEAGWLMAVLTAPLFFNVYSNRHVEADQLAVLHVVALVMLAAWLLGRIERAGAPNPDARSLVRAPLALPALTVVAVHLVTSLTSVMPRLSLLGQYVRPEGALTVLTYVAIFLMALDRLRTRRQLERLILTVVLTSLPIAAYAILQRLELDPLTWSGDMSARVGATLGNPIFLAAYLIMAGLLTLGAALNSLRALAHDRSMAAFVRTAGLALVLVLQVAAIVLSISRGPWVGALVGMFLFVLLWAAAARRRRWVLALVGLAVAGLIFLVVLNLPDSPLSALRDTPYLGALSRIFESESGTGQVRTLIWEGDAQLMLGGALIQSPDGAPDPLSAIRPFTGYGPDTLYLVFRQVAPWKLIDLHGPITLTVRSHNETWDTLVNSGLLGLIASQVLLASIFLYGLRWMGLMPSRRHRNQFIALWAGLGLAGGALVVSIGQARFLGLAIPAGNLIGLAAYVVMTAFGAQSQADRATLPVSDQILLAALLGGIAAHVVEIQFGQAIAATRVMFWAFAALLVAVGSGRLMAAAETESQAARRYDALAHALIMSAILSTLLFEFVTRHHGLSDPLAILWRGLSFDAARNVDSLAALGLLTFTWLVMLALAAADLRRPASLALAALVSWLLTFGCGLGLAAQLGTLDAPPIPQARPADVLRLHEQLVGLLGYFVAGRLIVMGLFAASRATGARRLPWTTGRRRIVVAMPVALALGVALSAAALAPVQADIAYKLGIDYDANPGAAIAAYQRAIAVQPRQDLYLPALAHALVYQSSLAGDDSASGFSDRTRFEDVLALDAAGWDTLNRNDLLFAAQLAFVRARELSPLHPEHSLHLARFYLPALPVDAPAETQLVALSDAHYAAALRLDRNNVRLWNEWADFNLRYRDDPAGALDALQQSLRRDDRFAPTYLLLVDAYLAQQDTDGAAQAIERALVLEPDRPDAVSKAAFVYFRQGRLEDAIAAYLTYIRLAPDAADTWEAHKNVALLRERLDDIGGAILEAESAAKLAPEDLRPQLVDLVDRLRAQSAAQ
jgi:hypothetical protein